MDYLTFKFIIWFQSIVYKSNSRTRFKPRDGTSGVHMVDIL